MTMLRVRRGIGLNSRVLKLGDRELARGHVFDTGEFPNLGSADWDRFKAHHLVEDVDAQDEERAVVARRQAAEMERVRRQEDAAMPPVEAEVGAPPPAPALIEQVSDAALSCGHCDFTAKNAHGLKVHVGRRHKSPARADDKE